MRKRIGIFVLLLFVAISATVSGQTPTDSETGLTCGNQRLEIRHLNPGVKAGMKVQEIIICGEKPYKVTY
jgi:hypothetical protein